MRIDLPYLDRSFPLEFPDENLLAVAEPNVFEGAGDTAEILREALENPMGQGGRPGQGLRDFIGDGREILIIINDATRPTPTEAMLAALMPVLEGLVPDEKRISLLVATGTHRPPTDTERRQILGSFYGRLKERTFCHDSRNDAELVDLGHTRGGTPISLNRRLFEADRIIVTGSVEPHYFAGFTGGRKAFLPGTAGFKTIETNHKQALSPAARTLALEGNPVHEDMMDALSLIKAPVFSLMTVLDKKQGVAAACAGDLTASFNGAVDIARKIFCVPVPSKADIVVTTARFPMDIDLYQSQKAIDNGTLALKDGGTLILVSSCRDGIGDRAYAELLAQAASPAEALERIRDGYRMGYHKAAKIAETADRFRLFVTAELPAELLHSMFMEKAVSPQAALDEALNQARAAGIRIPKILVLPDGGLTVPDPGL
ncbi:nickel-dependent lactate racemase [Treponema sp. OttesenSCG-928-L16]|nr:nickel-dependent lactate racemase [Treponema sp. OttesenSCG-928-L16]